MEESDSRSDSSDVDHTSGENIIDSEDGESESGLNKTKKRSKVWEHFKEVQVNGVCFAKCNYCSTRYTMSSKANRSTGNLKSHLIKSHKTQYNMENHDPQQPEVTQFYITACIFKKQQTFDRDKLRQALLKWIVVSNQPHTEIEQDTFLNVLKSVNPALPVSSLQISADTIKSDLMTTYKEEQSKIKPLVMANEVKLSVTHHVWTSKNQIAFMGMKAHWISNDWEIKQLLIGFPNIVGSHTGINIAAVFLSGIEDAGIPLHKVLGITTDNASNNDAFFREFQKLCHENQVSFTENGNRVRCVTHILNLAVQSLLEHLEVTPTLEDEDYTEDEIDTEITEDLASCVETKVVVKLRKLVGRIRASPQRRGKLTNACKQNNTKENQLVIDVKTRWNSTHAMITRALELKIPILVFCSSEPEFQKHILTESDWSALEHLMVVLQYFDRATEHLSMSRHVTITSVVPMFDWISDKLTSFISDGSSPALTDAASKAYDKIQKYFPDPEKDELLFTAVILNPSCKLQYFKEHDWDSRSIKKMKNKIINTFMKYYARASDTTSPGLVQEEEEDDF
ncbi:putative AC transposase [Folsomia candida]|uniref:Putative AC transposase n=1 Tax=Folsomia candida TaxID=158441 RepID=A0A226DAM4_FOLCA|nr:putative AC transposase [Folsomia candida]